MNQRRRNPVRGRQGKYVAGIAAVSGVLAAVAGLRPTGSAPVDVVLVAAAAGAATWAGATAPWWLVAMVSLLAAAIGDSAVLVGVAMVGVVLASALGAQRRNKPWVRSLAVLLAVQVLARGEVQWFFGASALFSCLALTVLFVWGVRRRPRSVRRQVWRVVAVAGGVAAVALAGFAIAALVARAPLAEGNRQARAGLAALDRGDMAVAAELFRDSARSFRRADSAVSAPWAQAARLVPVAAQHRSALSELTADAADALARAAAALAQVDPGTLRMVDGRIDIQAVQALQVPFAQLEAAITQLQGAVAGARSSWLAGPLQRRLDRLRDELADNRARADNALLAVQVAPRMLGVDGLRRYFIAFTTPAEARGLGGFMGNWAELTIDNGRIEMTRFGRTGELHGAGDSEQRTLTGLDEFVQYWGRFGFANHAGGTAGETVWSNVTMAPDFPTVAQVISQLYPQSGGLPLDGVFMLDPQAIATLINFTGPITVDGIDQPLTSQNAAQFIIKDQYAITADEQRVDLLDAIARTTVKTLLSSTLPPPAELARQFAPLAAEGRLTAWSADPEEQSLFARVKMDGAFPSLHGGDGVAVTVDNASASKIDAYLKVDVHYAAGEADPTGVTQGVVTVQLTNTAPSAGLAPIVIGNGVGLPSGTNRTWLSVYTALPMVGVQIDGRPAGMHTAQVLGWNAASSFIDIPPGGTVTVVLTVKGSLADATGGPVVTRTQPLAITPTFTVS